MTKCDRGWLEKILRLTIEYLRSAKPSIRTFTGDHGQRGGRVRVAHFSRSNNRPRSRCPQDLRAESESGNTVLMGKTQQIVLEAAGREVVITNPDKVFFPQAGHTKLDLARYYAAIAGGALRGIAARPIVLKRYVNGADHEPFFQKRAPKIHPEWVETVELRFPSGRTAREIVVREVARRAPEQATSKWWKEERHGVFLDYNQNAKDRTVASAWSVRPTPDARVSMPLEWDEVAGCDPAAFTLVTAPARFAEYGDASGGIDAAAGSLDKLLELSAAQEAAGLGDAPRPPHYRKQDDEPPRVAPSRRKGAATHAATGPGRRPSTHPLVTIAKAEHRTDALAGLERWKARHPEAADRLHVDDVLIDTMRGRSSTWTRIRVNLRHVPEAERPTEEPPDPDYDPWRDSGTGRRPSRAPKTRSSS